MAGHPHSLPQLLSAVTEEVPGRTWGLEGEKGSLDRRTQAQDPSRLPAMGSAERGQGRARQLTQHQKTGEGPWSGKDLFIKDFY